MRRPLPCPRRVALAPSCRPFALTILPGARSIVTVPSSLMVAVRPASHMDRARVWILHVGRCASRSRRAEAEREREPSAIHAHATSPAHADAASARVRRARRRRMGAGAVCSVCSGTRCVARAGEGCARAAARSIVAAPSAEPLTRLSQRHRPPATIWWPCTRLKIFGECTTAAARAQLKGTRAQKKRGEGWLPPLGKERVGRALPKQLVEG